MPRPPVDIEATRTRLLDICEDMICERGAVSFTMTDIAQAASMSQSNVYRFFENKEQLAEAMAERWFQEMVEAMEKTVSSDLPAQDKMYRFFAVRLSIKRARHEKDPALFHAYLDLGQEHMDVVRGYYDLADHYMSIIIAEAMEEGRFAGYEIDETVSIINLMVQPFCNPKVMIAMMDTANAARLAIVIETIFTGLHTVDIPAADNDRARSRLPRMKLTG